MVVTVVATRSSRSVDRSLFFNLPYPGGETYDRVSPLKNPILLAVMLLAIGLQVSAVELPFMNQLLDTTNLNLKEWLLILTTTFSIVVIIEMIKIVTAFYNNFKGITKDDINDDALIQSGIDI